MSTTVISNVEVNERSKFLWLSVDLEIAGFYLIPG